MSMVRRDSAPLRETLRRRYDESELNASNRERWSFMSRSAVNFLLDSVLLVAFCALIVCTTILRFVFPPGTVADDWILWGFTYDQWMGLEFGLVAALALGFMIHVMLHWNWVCGFVAQRISRKKGKVDDGAQTIYGVGLLIVVFHILGAFIAAAALMIRGPE